MARQAGYNVYITQGGKKFIGVTSDEMSVETNTKESTTKDTPGVKKKRVTSHAMTFRISGLIDVTGGTASQLNNDAIMALAMATAPFAIVYNRGDGSNWQGTAIATGYSESTPADPDEDSTYSLNLRSRNMTKVSNG